VANPTQAQIQAIIDAGKHVQVGGVLYGKTHGQRTAPTQAVIDAVYAAMAAVHQHHPLQGN
jgi:hypothetical protein